MQGTTVTEAAFLRFLFERVPNATQRHVRALLCILRAKDSYLSMQEIEKNTLIGNGELRKIMHSFSKNRLVQKDGCLYRKPESEKIAEII